MSTWEEIGEKWNRAQQMGWQAIQAAMDVGEELQQKKIETPHGEFRTRVSDLDINERTARRLMRLALHRELIEEHKPESMRGALALLPKVPTKTSEKQIQTQKDELSKYEEFAKKTAAEQAKVLAAKRVKIKLKELQNEAHDAVMKELKAVKQQLQKERERVGELMEDAAKKRQFYEDLLNQRANGHDFRQAVKILKQAVHPDRTETSSSLRAKAMKEIKFISNFLGI